MQRLTFSPPLFFDASKQWDVCHWICYPYLVWFFMFLLQVFYNMTKSSVWVEWIRTIGNYSYDIFLFQMPYFSVLRRFFVKSLSFSLHATLPCIVVVTLMDLLLCIIPSLIMRKWHLRKSSSMQHGGMRKELGAERRGGVLRHPASPLMENASPLKHVNVIHFQQHTILKGYEQWN